MTTLLWNWPARDEAAWQSLTGYSLTHAAYPALLAAAKADHEWRGREVRRVYMTVAAMREAIAAHGLENTPAGRAAALALPSPADLADLEQMQAELRDWFAQAGEAWIMRIGEAAAGSAAHLRKLIEHDGAAAIVACLALTKLKELDRDAATQSACQTEWKTIS